MKNLILLSSIILILAACAQVVAPTGGKKDETGPKVAISSPANQIKNFKGRKVYLEFDELIDATSVRQELIITPTVSNTYNLKAKPYSIELSFSDDFEDSTTYTINFRQGIKDLSEKNPSQNLKLVFSTGAFIDSLNISGHVDHLLTDELAKGVTIGLYDLQNKIDTIPLLKQRPKYFTVTDTSGNFALENLKSSKYQLIAFQDKNNNLLPDTRIEHAGYHYDTINLTESKSALHVQVFPNNREKPKIEKSLSRQSTYTIRYSKGPVKTEIAFTKPTDSLYYKLQSNELIFFNYPPVIDTIPVNITITDSLDLNLTHTQKVIFNTPSNSKAHKHQNIPIKVTGITPLAKIKRPRYYRLDFQKPITYFNPRGIHIISDTLRSEPFTAIWDDSSHTSITIHFNSTATRQSHLNIDASTFKDYLSDTNVVYQLINNIYPQQELGSINGTFEQFKGQKIIQLCQEKTWQVIEEQIFTTKYNFPDLIPGTYRVRIIEDKNANALWDTADFEKNTPAENVFIGKGSIKVKSNFELNDLKLE